MGADASTAPLGSSKSKKQVPIFHQILIVIHGSRKSGKTSLLRRMNGLNYQPQYTPTKCMQASEIIWHPICMSNESIKIIVWDVVDKAIDPTPQSQRTKQLPDASNTDTFSRADGIIVVYDPRDEESIKYARGILDQAPQSKPTLIVMNFSDSFETTPSVPSLMEPYTNSFFHLTASMKTNQGLAELANWLDLPMNVSLSKIYELHLKQSEEKLNGLLKEFNLTGFDENAESPKVKESSKDFWSTEADDRRDDTFGTNEVSADFFMDDDESDLKAKQNLEKLKKKLNLTELEEEDYDEEMKLKMAKKKSKILSKNPTNNSVNQPNKILNQTQDQNQDENEYNESNDDDNDSNKPPPQAPIPKITFDIPVVADNDNDFFDNDENDINDQKDIENNDVDNKLEELKKKLNLEIPNDEDEEERPKVKKSKILPKVKPHQIIIKPAQPKSESETPNSTNNETKNVNTPTLKEEEIAITPNESITKTDETDITTKTDTITMPSFGDENKKSAEDNITFPSFSDENEINIEEKGTSTNINEENKIDDNFKIEMPTSGDIDSLKPNDQVTNKETPSVNIPTISDFPSFGNDDFFGGDDEHNNLEEQLSPSPHQLTKTINEEEEMNEKMQRAKIEKKSKILPKKENSVPQPQIENKTPKETDNISNSNSIQSDKTESKQLSEITFPSFGDDTNFFSDDDKKENKEVTFPSFDERTNVLSEESKTNEETKSKEEPFTLPSFDDDSKEKDNKIFDKKDITFPSFDDNQAANPDTNNKLSNITFPSFGDDSNFFSDGNDNQNKNKTKPDQTTITLPSIDININENKSSNFFSDDEIKTETKEEANEIAANDDKTQKKKRPIILPKQNNSNDLNTVSTTRSITLDDQATSNKNEIATANENKLDLDSININSDLGENNDSFFTDKQTSNNQAISDLPPPPPIDFSNSFLSEKTNSTISPQNSSTMTTLSFTTTTTTATTNKMATNSSNLYDNAESDLDILNAIRKQEAERAERARQIAALLEASTAEQNASDTLNANTTPIAASSQAGDYEMFDDTPQTSTTKERKHRKHRSHKHKSGKRGKTEETDEQNEGGEGENNENYMSFD